MKLIQKCRTLGLSIVHITLLEMFTGTVACDTDTLILVKVFVSELSLGIKIFDNTYIMQ